MRYNKSMVGGHAPHRERGAAYLTVIIAHKEVQRKPITGLNAIVIGRNLDCDLWIDDPMLSRRHCQLEPQHIGGFFLRFVFADEGEA